MGRRAAAIAGLLALVLAGCGGKSGSAGSLDTPLSYMPARGAAVAVVSTDLDSERYDELNGELAERAGIDGGLEKALKGEIERGTKLSWEDDVEPVLGNDLALAVEDARVLLPDSVAPIRTGGDLLVALEVRDEGKARRLLEKVFRLRRSGETRGADLYQASYGEDEIVAALDGDVLIAATSRGALDRALDRHRNGAHLTAAAFDAATREAGPRDAIVRAYADPKTLLDVPRLRPLLRVKWIAALRSAGVTFDIAGENGELALALNTGAGVTERDLPLAVGNRLPGLVERPGEVAGASANQSWTTAFLLSAVRAAYPRSAFVRHVAAAERDLKIDFEREFLRQFDGPSASTAGSDGAFAARSTVRDPRRMAALLERLAPRLPRLVADLQALGSRGLSLLFLFAPDAPVATREFSAGGITLRTLDGGLYSIEGLSQPSPPRVVFGLVGDVFVVASDEARAREMATAPSSPPPAELSGASVMRGDLSDLPPTPLQTDSQVHGEATGSLDATPSRLLGRLRFPIGQLLLFAGG